MYCLLMRKDTAASPSKKQKGGSSSLARGRKFIYLFWPPSIPLFLSFCFCCLGVDNEKNKINARLSMRKKWTQRTNQAQHHPSVTLLRCRVPQQKQSTIQTFLNVQTNPRSHCATPTQTATPTAAVHRRHSRSRAIRLVVRNSSSSSFKLVIHQVNESKKDLA